MSAIDESREPFPNGQIPSSPAASNPASADSVILKAQPIDPRLLKIKQDGATACVAFNLEVVQNDLCLANYRTQILRFLQEFGCNRFSLDVSGLPFLPSGLLGLLASVKTRGYEVEIVNPSEEMCEALRTTMLDSIIAVRYTVA